jgi:hypothetical protein
MVKTREKPEFVCVPDQRFGASVAERGARRARRDDRAYR